MDNKFPCELFPHFYTSGPPDFISRHNFGGWGSYGQVLEVNGILSGHGNGHTTQWKFGPQHQVKGEIWVPVEPTVAPLLPPNKAGKLSSGPLSDPMDFPEHMQNFYQDNPLDAFNTMSHLLGEHFNFGRESKKNTVNMARMKHFLTNVKYKKCPVVYYGKRTRRYHHLLDDVIHDIPSGLLAELLHEELALQREREQFHEVTTGGALGYIPFPGSNHALQGCLVYPRAAGLHSLNFHRVVLEFNDDKSPSLNISSEPHTFQLNGTIRQISVGNMQDSAHIGVRSDHLCGVWVVGDAVKPRALEVIQTKQPATCLSASPHVPEELLVASESGAAYLWTVGKGLRKVREEDSNLYFNAKSSWRWCEFSAHPRVMVYADRTGVELTDCRNPVFSHTLFRIGKTPGCRSGERVILAKYLSEVHAHHHLVTTQHSAYIMDERLPCMPMVKWDHTMEYPPMFAHVLAGSSEDGTNKVLLGSQHSQELMLLQYSGGREHACRSRGPPQKLLSPSKSLSHLPVQLPHRQSSAQERLGAPAAGLTSIQGEGYLCVLQLSEAGDIFHQTLRLSSDNATSDEDLPGPAHQSDEVEDQTGATERPQSPVSADKDPSGEDSDEGEGRRGVLSKLEVVVNDDMDHSYTSDVELEGGKEPGVIPTAPTQCTEMDSSCTVRLASPVKASEELLLVWEKWLSSIFKKTDKRKHHLPHWTTKTKDLVACSVSRRDTMEEDRFQSLRRDLKEAMRRKGLLVQGATYLPPLAVTPLPDVVVPSEWPDDLSQRMSLSWEGGWKNWWEEKLGMNRDRKIEALRRKRRLEKQARVRHRVSLSGSFTSSINYQDDLSGWSSATSQDWGSDVDSVATLMSMQEKGPSLSDITTRSSVPESEPQNSHLSPVAATDATSSATTAILKLTPQRRPRGPEQDDLCSPFGSQTPKNTVSESEPQNPPLSLTTETDTAPSTTGAILKPTPQRKPKRSEQDYLSSLFGSQEPSQDMGQESSFSFIPPVASSSQLPSFSSSQRLPQVRASSQTSLASQPKKKRSRMGF